MCQRWSDERRRSRGWLADEPVQFPKFWREPYRADAQWYFKAERELYPNFAKWQYLKAYMTFLQEHECDTGNKSVSLIPSNFANGYTLYAFNIIDGPIGPGTYNLQSKSATESARLEVSFAAAVNNNIKVVLLYKMLIRLEFDRFNAVLVQWTLAINFTLERSIFWSHGF